MRALPRRMAVIQYVNIVRLCHVGKAVGNQDDRLAPGQPVDARHDVVLALHVDVGRCLVKNVDGTVMQQCAGQCQPLPLAAGQVAAALGQRGVQSVHRAQEVRQIHLLQRAPQRTVVCVGRGHPQVVGHRTFKEVAAQADERYIFEQAGLADGGKLLPADGHMPRVAGHAPGQHGGNRGLAAAALAHQRGEAALREVKI